MNIYLSIYIIDYEIHYKYKLKIIVKIASIAILVFSLLHNKHFLN